MQIIFRYFLCLYFVVVISPAVFGQTPLVSTKVNEALKRQLNSEGKFIEIEMADGTSFSTAPVDQGVIPNSSLAPMTTKTYKGRTAGTTGTPEDVAVATLKTDLVLVKGDVGLGNVDNTSDANKPVSTAAQTALDLKVTGNVGITGATNTKITYDAKGLVTSGTAATTADIAASTDKNYVTDAQAVVIGNTSGTNTGNNATNSQYSSLVSNATHTGDASGATALTVVGINGTLMSGLATGIVKNTTTTGIPSIAVAGDFPTLNQNTTGTSGGLTGTPNISISSVANSGGYTQSGTTGNTFTGTPIFSNATYSALFTGGNVGVGTSTPGSILHVYGAQPHFKTESNGTTFAYHSFYINNGASYGRIGIEGSSGAELIGGSSAYDMILANMANYSLQLGTNGSIWMTIKNNGNIGNGTSTPSAQLHTTGTVRFQNFGAGTANFDANGNISSVSDERLKIVDSNFNYGLNQILGIQPIKYHWNELSGLDKNNQYTGFSAQNVRRYLPEAVSIDSRGYYNLQDRVIIAALVNAVKDLSNEINTIRTELLLTKRVININDRTADKIVVVMSKVTPVKKQCELAEIVTEEVSFVESVKEIVNGVEIVKEVTKAKTVIKKGITEIEGVFYRDETEDEALSRYQAISQE